MSQPIRYPVGTQIVVEVDLVQGGDIPVPPRGAIGTITESPESLELPCQVRFNNGEISPLYQHQFTELS